MVKQRRQRQPIKYSKRPGFHLKGDVAEIGKRLQKLEGSGGEISPAVVVEDAQDPQSPLHDEFEWNDTLAAQEYRLEQARYVLRAIETEWTYEEVDIKTRSYASIDADDTPYRETRKVLTNKELRQQWKAQALLELKRWRAKYAQISELNEIFKAVDKVL